MKRRLRPGILLTVAVASSGGLACGGSELVQSLTGGETLAGNPPPPRPVKATFPSAPFGPHTPMEPRDEEGRLIKHSGTHCWVELPFTEPQTSWRPPPTQAVVCPPELLADPAYADCAGGDVTLLATEPALDCICYFDGNPPPGPKDVACPTIAIPALLTAGKPAG